MLTEQAKQTIDAVAVTTTVSAVAGWLPPLAAAATIVWTLIRIFETKSVQGLVKRLKDEPDDR